MEILGTKNSMCKGDEDWQSVWELKVIQFSDKYMLYHYWSTNCKGTLVKGPGRRGNQGLQHKVFYLERFGFSYEKPLKL